MRIEFDTAKDASNRARHGVSLGLARELDWDAALVWVDDRFGEIAAELSVYARPTRREVKHYVENI